jgi:hypothetical protein
MSDKKLRTIVASLKLNICTTFFDPNCPTHATSHFSVSCLTETDELRDYQDLVVYIYFGYSYY